MSEAEKGRSGWQHRRQWSGCRGVCQLPVVGETPCTLRIKCALSHVTKLRKTPAGWKLRAGQSAGGCSTPLPCRRKCSFRKDVDLWQRQSAVRLHDRTDWGTRILQSVVIFKRNHRKCYRWAEEVHFDRPVPRREGAIQVKFDSIMLLSNANKQIWILGRDQICHSQQKKHIDLSPNRC
jgi:hypothetical protein